jgi:hypothetical protein
MWRRLSSAGLGLLLLGISPFAQAIALEDLFDGESLTSQDKVFYDWGVLDASRVLRTTTGDQTLNLNLDYSEINVSLNIDDILNPTLQFSASESAGLSVNPPDGGGTEILKLVFSYKVETLDGLARIVGNSLALTEWQSSPIYRVGVTETLGGSSGGVASSEVYAFNYDDGTVGTFKPLDLNEFQPQGFLFVTTTVELVAANNGPAQGSARLTSFQQGFRQIPEPATLALLGVGLAGIGYRRYGTKVAA